MVFWLNDCIRFKKLEVVCEWLSLLQVFVKLSDGRSFDGKVCAYHFHYNLVVLSYKSDSPLQSATLRQLEDCLHLNPSQLINSEEKSFQLCPHSNPMILHSRSMILSPGDDVVAVGRYFDTPFDLMAAPGEYWYDKNYLILHILFIVHVTTNNCSMVKS